MCFNPLPSCEGRLSSSLRSSRFDFASIHFPLAREDNVSTGEPSTSTVLQSTSLLRGKTSLSGFSSSGKLLQSTSLLRGKTAISSQIVSCGLLQSTSLLRGKTLSELIGSVQMQCFNPLPSCEGRLLVIHAETQPICFNPLPSCEGRRQDDVSVMRWRMLQSTSLLRGKTILPSIVVS